MLSTSSADSPGLSSNVVLLVSAAGEDHALLPKIFRGTRWAMRAARTAKSGVRMIRRLRRDLGVVICQHSLPDGDWKLMLEETRRAETPASLIVSSRLADERLWAEVLNLGAFDLLLGAPFDSEEVLRVTESAWSAWDHATQRAVQRIPAGSASSPNYGVARQASAGW